MAWKEISLNELAKKLGVSAVEVREKQKLTQLIISTRKRKGLTQAALAKKMGLSQGRIAQIESGMGTVKVTFDILFNILAALGYGYKVLTRKAA